MRELINPATGALHDMVADTPVEAVARAVARARAAFAEW
jgi:betaine-aldehyde dehydrogenase